MRMFFCFASPATLAAMSLLLMQPALAEQSVEFRAGGRNPTLPTVILQDPPVGILQRSDGSFAFYNMGGPAGEVVRTTLAGNQVTLKPTVEFPLPAGTNRERLLLDDAGELHEVYLLGRGEGRKIAVDRFIDLWHRKTSGGHAKWDEAQLIWKGYCGALMHFVRLPSGRIIAPFGEWLPNVPSAPPTGPNVVTAVYSDDFGQTWQQSPAQLTSPCYANHNGSNYGACEPAILRLNDGRLYMLMRTQAGFLYESWSEDDGATWQEASASRFHSSSGPPGLTRLPDGQIVAFWNNCAMPPRFEGDGVYGGRDALHAAISDDEGKTWRGFREVYRDPYRNDTPPKTGDRGTAYPFGAYDASGQIMLVSGQGRGRRNFVRIDPDWLRATQQEDDFSEGLDQWHVFKGFGPASGFWRDRTVGATLVDHPDREGAKALHIRRPDDKDPDGATWNFSAGWKGELTLRLFLQSGFQGASIALTDRMFEPTDSTGERLAIFRATLNVDGELGADGWLDDHNKLAFDAWHELTFRWDLEAKTCTLTGAGVKLDLPQQHPASNGLSYLRLRSRANEIDEAGFLVDFVRASVDSTAAPARTSAENRQMEQYFIDHR